MPLRCELDTRAFTVGLIDAVDAHAEPDSARLKCAISHEAG